MAFGFLPVAEHSVDNNNDICPAFSIFNNGTYLLPPSVAPRLGYGYVGIDL